MKSRSFVYDLVEDTTIKKKPNIEVVLTKFVDGIGEKGDVVSLSRNNAYYNFLLPGLAVYKTDESLKKYARKEDDQTVEDMHSSPFAQRVSFVMSQEIYGALDLGYY